MTATERQSVLVEPRAQRSDTPKKPEFTALTDSVKELAIIAGLLLAALIIGLITEALGWSLFIATLVWLTLQIREYRKVARWARRPFRQPRNGSEAWFQLAYQPFRTLQRERARTKAMADRLREILSLAEVIPDAVIVLSQHGEIEGMNNAAKELLYLTDRDIGLVLTTVVRNPDFIRFIRSGNTDEPLEFVSSMNQERMYEARRIETDIGRTIMLVRDITALNRLLTMRQNFVANVSHELRTPLTVVSGYLETILDEEQSPDLRLELTQRLNSPIKRMQNLVNDLMLLTQLESTPADTHRHTVKLGRIIRAAVNELQPLCGHPDQICVDIQADPPISGIETELHSVCVNLLSNAIRYSPEDRPIRISLSEHDDGVRLRVQDHGYGIAPEHLSRLTERFYRVDLAGARTRGGTGLGLAIVKHVLLRHESELQIQSTLGEGSSFFCDFKRAAASPAS